MINDKRELDMLWYDRLCHDMNEKHEMHASMICMNRIWCDMICMNITRYAMIWNDMEWYAMIWNEVRWYDKHVMYM